MVAETHLKGTLGEHDVHQSGASGASPGRGAEKGEFETEIYAARAENAELWDVDGKRYIDFAGGIAVLNTGHRHPR